MAQDREESSPVAASAATRPYAKDIGAHVERHIGRVSRVFTAVATEPVQLDVLQVTATKERPFHTLITSGMGELPMRAPRDARAPRRLELAITLPEYWQLDDEALCDEVWRWPLDLLTDVALHPHRKDTSLAWGDTITHGDPPRPLASDTQLCGAIVAPSLLVPREFYELDLGERSVVFYSVIPLYAEEIELERREGMESLLTKLIDHGIRDLVNPHRRNVALKKKRFRLFRS